MKKLLARLLLALAPFWLYLAVFVAFEPNNYFGLRNESGSSAPVARMRGYAHSMADAVILGDSRMAHFDMALVNEASGRTFYNASFGGASLRESIDAFYYLLAQNPDIDTVVFGVSFYTLNEKYDTDRMSTIEEQVQNPFAYIFNLEYNINTITAIRERLAGTAGGEETAEHTQAEYRDAFGALPWRRDFIAYAALLYSNCAAPGTLSGVLADIPSMTAAMESGELSGAQLAGQMLAATPADSKFAVNETQLARLEALAAECAARDIALTIVLPPMHESVRALVCAPLGIDSAMQPALARIRATGARVLDYEWENPPDFSDGMFYDGFHVDTVYGLPQLTEMIFGREA